jgi:threonine/homoserine/homoserine lactone efflux protein
MALEEFEKDPMSERHKGYLRMRSIMDYGMGLLWMGMGVYMLFNEYFNSGLVDRFDGIWLKVFGGICLLYGGFRIYRGYKKNYLRER